MENVPNYLQDKNNWYLNQEWPKLDTKQIISQLNNAYKDVKNNFINVNLKVRDRIIEEFNYKKCLEVFDTT